MFEEVITLSNYFFNPHAVLPALTFLFMLMLAIIVIVRAGVTMNSVTLFLLAIAIDIWFFSFAWMYSARDEQIAFWWAKAAYFGIPFITVAAYHFTVSVLKVYDRYRKHVMAMWGLSSLLCFSAVGTPFIITGMHRYRWGYHPLHGPWGVLFISVFFVPLLLSLLHLRTEYRIAPPKSEQRKRIGLLRIALGVASFGGFDYFANYHIGLFPVGGISVLMAIILIVIAIWRYNLVEFTPSFAASNIIETMRDGLFVLDNEWTVRLTNRAASQLTGIPETEIIGKAIWQVFEDESVMNELGNVESSRSMHTFELQHQIHNDAARLMNMSASVMNRDSGELLAIVCIVRDITKQKLAEMVLRRAHDELEGIVAERTSLLERTNARLREEIKERLKAEEALRAREERYRTLFENSTDAIFVLDHKKMFIDANPAAYALFVATRDEVIGRNIRSFFSDASMIGEIFKEIDAEGSIRERELRVRDRYGKELVCVLTASLWKDDKGVPIGYQGILRDVTLERHAEKELMSTQW